MNGNSPGPARAWKIGFLLAGAFLAAVAVSSYGFITVRDRNWARLEARVQELQTEILQTPPLPRLALGRPVLSGNAWDDYLKAWDVPSGLPAVGRAPSIRDYLERKPGVSREAIERQIAQERERIALLRSAVRREEARPPALTMTVNGLQMPERYRLARPGQVPEAMVGGARLLIEEGRVAEALQDLTDLCVASRDWAGARLLLDQVNALYTMTTALNEIRDLLQSAVECREEWSALDRALALVDDGFPDTTRRLWGHLFRFGELLIREDRSDEIYLYLPNETPRVRRCWRFGYSSRLQAASEFFTVEDFVRREIELEKLPWSAGESVNQALYREQKKHWNAMIADDVPRILDIQLIVKARGALRLVRAAVHYRATGATMEVEDPVEGTIQMRPMEGKLLFWKKPLFNTKGWEPKKADTNYWYWNTIEVPRR